MQRIVGGMLRWSERHPVIFAGLVMLGLGNFPIVAVKYLGFAGLIAAFCVPFLLFPIALCGLKKMVNAPRGFAEEYTEHIAAWANK
jgi:hypothetical protein